MPVLHDAFISYNHDADGSLGPAVERALEQLAKPLFKLRACDVFLDRTGLAAHPSLWGGILEHLEGSRWFLLLASPQSAQAPWCRKELSWWLERHGTRQLLILLTAGDIAWDEARRDFDWKRTTALASLLSGRFDDEPLYVDLRTLPREPPLTLKNAAFRERMIDVAAPIRGMRKEALESEELHVLRRTRRAVAGGLAGIALALSFGAWRTFEGLHAERGQMAQRLFNLVQQNADDRPERDARPDLASMQALLAWSAGPGALSTLALLDALDAADARLVRYAAPMGDPAGRVTAAGVDVAGGLLALARCEPPARDTDCLRSRIDWQLLDGPGSRPLPPPRLLDIGTIHGIEFPAGTREMILLSDQGAFRLDLDTPSAGPALIVRQRGIAALALTRDRALLAAGFRDGEAKVWRTGQGIHPCLGLLRLRRVARDGLAFSPDGRYLAGTDGHGGINVIDLAEGGNCRLTRLRSMDSTGAVGFDASGRWLLALMLDGTPMRWEVGSAAPMEAFNPGGNQQPLLLSAQMREASGHALSPDGRQFAIADGRRIKLQGAAHGDPAALPPPAEGWRMQQLTLRGHPDDIVHTRFSSDGRWLVSRDRQGVVLLWRLDRKDPLMERLPRTDARLAALQAGWQRDGAVRTRDGLSARIETDWDRDSGNDTPRAVGLVVLSAGPVAGAQHEAGQRDSLVRRVLLRREFGLEEAALQFTPEGKLALRSAEGEVTLWHIDPPSLVARACDTAGRQATAAEIRAWTGTSRLMHWFGPAADACPKG